MPDQTTDARAIHASALIVDGHVDTPQRLLDEPWHLDDALGPGMLNLESARQGNLAAAFFALWVDPAEHPDGTHARRAFALLDAVDRELARLPQQLALCLSPEDIVAARAAGRFGILLSLEGGHAIEDSLERLDLFYDRGVRSMTLTWNNANHWADSSLEPAHHHGLTAFGKDVLRRMNQLGMLIDIAHVSDDVFWQALDISTAPILATHSNARALTPSPRNLTNDQLRALAAHHGVCMVNFFPGFLDDRWRLAWNALAPERQARQQAVAAPFRAAGKPVPYPVSSHVDREFAARIGPPPFDALIAHIEHILNVAGIDHVGLGSDFDGVPGLPAGMQSAQHLPLITEALRARGYTAEDLHKLLGGNFLRVFSAAAAASGASRG